MALATAEYPTIEFIEERLGNGLRVIMSVDHLVPIVAVDLWYNVGSNCDTPGRTGIAHLFEHMMFEGSAHLKKGDHFNIVTSMGGATNAGTSPYYTAYFEFAPSHQLELMLWLEADRMGGLLDALKQETLDNQRDVVRNERRQSFENQPYGLWQEQIAQTVFPEGHPYHHHVIGSQEDLAAASLKDVKDFFRTYYVPNNAVLSIVGDFDPKKAMGWVEKYFGKIPAAKKLPERPELDLPLRIGSEVRNTLRDRVPVPGVFIAHRSPGEGTREADVMTVAAAVLGLGRGSRMYQRLVKEQFALEAQFGNLTQPGVSVSFAVGIAWPGIFNEVIEAELIKVMDSLKTEDVTQDELTRAKAQLERGIIDSLSTVAARADWLSQHATLYGDPDKANRRLEELMSVTPAEIKKVASEVLVKDNRSVITFLPKPRDPKRKRVST